MSTAATRIYIARAKAEGVPPRLIDAPNAAQAARHIVRTSISIDVATQQDIVAAMKAGIEVESAGGAESDPS